MAMKYHWSLPNSWLLKSIVIGLASLLVFYCIVQLLSRIGDMNDSIGPVLLAFCAVMFFCGAASSIFIRSGKAGTFEKLKASMLAACIPVLAIDLFLLSAYITNTSQYYSGYDSSLPVRPTEPPFLPVYLLIMAIITTIGLVTSGMGGILIRWLQD